MFLFTLLTKLIVLFKGNNLKTSNILYEQILLDCIGLKNVFFECILFFIHILQFNVFLPFCLLSQDVNFPLPFEIINFYIILNTTLQFQGTNKI